MHPIRKTGRMRIQAFRKRVRAIRRRTEHVSRRRESFGVARLRSLLWIPCLLLAITLAALLRAPAYNAARFQPVSPTVARPLCGWAVDAESDPESVTTLHSLAFAMLTWRELEPSEGVYDFDAFEKRVHLSAWRKKGVRLVLRFVCDAPGDTPHADIPDYLVERLGADAGAPYVSKTYGAGFSPNYANLLLQEKHHAALTALGARYGGADSPVAFVELGSLGHNGLWLVDRDADVAPLPLAADAKTYIWHYAEAFPAGRLLMRLPYQQARVLNAGVYDPFFGDAGKTWEWLDMLQYGGYDEQLGADLRAMPGQTLRGAALTDPLLLEGDADALRQQARACALTYVAGLSGADMSDAAQTNARLLDDAMGYRLWIRRAEWRARVRGESRLRIRCTWINSGVAPMSEKWPMELSLLDGDGGKVCAQIADVDLTSLTEGAHTLPVYLDIPLSVAPGRYRVAVAVLDPATGEPAVELCMDSERDGLRAILGEIDVIR